MAHGAGIVVDLARGADPDAEQVALIGAGVGEGLLDRIDHGRQDAGGPLVLGCGQPALSEDIAVLVDDDRLDLGAPEVDPGTQHQRDPFPSGTGQRPPFSQ